MSVLAATARSTRLPGNGRMLPHWLYTQDPEALLGTARVRSVDRNFLIGLDLRRDVYQLWGPSPSQGGWVPLMEMRDDYGRPLYPPVPWELVMRAIVRGRESGETAVDEVRRHNERLQRAEQAHTEREGTEAAKYAARAIGQEWDGTSRFSAEDVLLGWKHASQGGHKAPPKGLVISIPRPLGGDP